MAGTTKSVSKVDTSMPPTTAIPMAIRPLQPSPEAKTRGSSPNIVDALVIKIGRSRWMDACLIAEKRFSP